MARQKSLTKGRWRAVALSLLLHAAIICAAVYGWFTWKRTPQPPTTLAIEATVVDARTLEAATTPKPEQKPPEPAPEPTPIEEQGPPKPDPAELERKKQEEQKAEQEKIDQQKQAEEKAQQQEKLEAEKQAAAKAESDKKALEKKKSDEAAAARKEAEEKARQARETELRKSLEAEERTTALRNSDAMARWLAQIEARIRRAWHKPDSAQAGIECIVHVTQVPGGEVTAVSVESCSGGDAALRESVKSAVYGASPLPSPPDPALFDRNLILTFKPE